MKYEDMNDLPMRPTITFAFVCRREYETGRCEEFTLCNKPTACLADFFGQECCKEFVEVEIIPRDILSYSEEEII